LLVHNFNHPAKEDFQLMHKLIKAFNTKFHLLQITSGKVDAEKVLVEANMKSFAELNNITNYEYHLINDKDVEKGVVHFNQMNNMDMVCIGTHGKGGIFHHSATEKLINHLFKPIISFHLN
jgi:nucleotide-binding universal stress UspA family protein